MHIVIWSQVYNNNKNNNLGKTTSPSDNQLKKRPCRIVDFTLPADHSIKLKESEKRNKYLALARELKKTMKLENEVIPVVIGTFGTVTKELVQRLEDLEIRGQVKTVQTTALLQSVRIPRRVLESCCQSELSGKPSANADNDNNSQQVIIFLIQIIYCYMSNIPTEYQLIFK